MAALQLDPALLKRVLADWRTGIYSQSKIAAKHAVSKGTVNRICKGVAQDMAGVVQAQVVNAVAVEVLREPDHYYLVPAIAEAVELRSAQVLFFNTAQGKLARIALKRVEQYIDSGGFPIEGFSMAELVQASTIMAACRTGILGKEPEVVITNTNAQQNNKLTYEVIK